MAVNFSLYLIPAFILIAFLVAYFKKVKVYDAFVSGVNEVIPLLLSIFPYLCTVIIMSELFEESGLSNLIVKWLKPALNLIGVPSELTKLILIKPLSGSGSLALLSDIYQTYGADSYVGKCASCIFSASETVFYISSVYFCTCKNKNAKSAIIMSLIACFLSCIFACFICRLL